MSWAHIGIGNFWRYRPLNSPAFLRLFPSMRQTADCARQNEYSSTQRRRKSQFRKDDRARTVDIEWNMLALPLLQRCFDRLGHFEIFSVYDLVAGCALKQFHQSYGARVDRMKSMPKSRHKFKLIDFTG